MKAAGGLFVSPLSVAARSAFFVLIPAVLALGQSPPCLEFQSPVSGSCLTGNACTLSVTACSDVRSVTFKAAYLSPDGTTPGLALLGNISRPPFKLVWDVSGLPNQLDTGMTLIAEAHMEDGSLVQEKAQGIFLTRVPIAPPTHVISYSSRNRARASGRGMDLSSPLTAATGKAFANWNQAGLFFKVEVADPTFYKNIPQATLAAMSVEVLIDPAAKREPFVSPRTIMVVVPLAGQAFRVKSEAVQGGESAFRTEQKNEAYPYRTAVTFADFKGYQADIPIPWSLLGTSRPTEMSLNVVASALDAKGQVERLSWSRDQSGAVHSPYVFGTVKMADEPLGANPVLLWVTCFALGLVLGGGGAFLYVNRDRFSGVSFGRFERSEEDGRLYESVKAAISREVTGAVTIERVAQSLGVGAKRIAAVMHTKSGQSFRDNLMRARVEIAQERLRSSHASETSIAQSCGFRDIDEMEKYFKKFLRTTPVRFRSEHQVS